MKWLTFLIIPTVVGTGVVFIQSDINGFLPSMNSVERAVVPSGRKPADARPRLIFAAGVVEGTDREVALNFEIEGRLALLVVDESSRVKKGDVLAHLGDSVLRYKLAEAEAKLALARAERERLINGVREETRAVTRIVATRSKILLDQALSDLRRAELLHLRETITDQELENNRYRWRSAQAEYRADEARMVEIEAPARIDDVKVADARIRLANAAVLWANEMLDKATLRAPRDGVILRITAEPGELIEPNRPEPLITMSNTEQLHARAYVEELDALSLSLGQSAYVTADGKPAERFVGTIVSLAPWMGAKRLRHHKPGERVDVKVREVLILLDNADDLVVGVPLDVFIEPTESNKVKVKNKKVKSPNRKTT